MRTTTCFAILAVAILAVGCSHGSATVRNGNYAVEGGGDTVQLIYASSYARTQEGYMQSHTDCMLAGGCWGYPGGLNTDLEHYYGNVGMLDGQGAGAATKAPSRDPLDDLGTGSAASAEDTCARELALDAIRGVRSLDRNEKVEPKGAPSCKKGGAQ